MTQEKKKQGKRDRRKKMAFTDLAEECVRQAIAGETEEAILTYGQTYSSMHEAYAVLKEEVEETEENLEVMKIMLDAFWKEIKENREITKAVIKAIRNRAEQTALEATQVAAVCEKILNTIDKGREI